ncbi:MAG TPA: inner membrane CreD family protein, partial [Sphingobacterium sp.]|nr:inner membrane CreD family protein [Sphingobacterium sp.]
METTPHSVPELPQQTSAFERLSNSILVKLLVILVLLLFLLIPLSWVTDLIEERQSRDESVKTEISQKWGGPQVISGPVIAVPYTFDYTTNVSDGKGKVIKQIETQEDYIFMVPQSLKVEAKVIPEYLKRGIYQSVVYNSELHLSGQFDELDLKKLGIDPERVNWAEAKLFLGMSDTKGLKANPTIKIGEQQLTFETNTTEINLFERTMVTSLDLSGKSTAGQFSVRYDLRGSRSLNVFPLADQNQILVQGEWSNP